TATGMTKTSSSIAARISASVKPAQSRLAARGLQRVGLNLIVQTVAALADPNLVGVAFVSLLKDDVLRTVVADTPIGREAERWPVARHLGGDLPRDGLQAADGQF